MQTTALLLIDLQNDYFPSFEGAKWPLHKTEEAAANAAKLLAQFREMGWPVIHVRHEFPTVEAPFFVPGSEGAQIHPSLQPLEGEQVILKHYANSFRETNLKAVLDDLGVERLVIVGAMSQMCVDAGTRAASDFGYRCFVAEDACAARDADFNGVSVPAIQVHATYMASLDFAYASVIPTADWLAGKYLTAE